MTALCIILSIIGLILFWGVINIMAEIDDLKAAVAAEETAVTTGLQLVADAVNSLAARIGALPQAADVAAAAAELQNDAVTVATATNDLKNKLDAIAPAPTQPTA